MGYIHVCTLNKKSAYFHLCLAYNMFDSQFISVKVFSSSCKSVLFYFLGYIILEKVHVLLFLSHILYKKDKFLKKKIQVEHYQIKSVIAPHAMNRSFYLHWYIVITTSYWNAQHLSRVIWYKDYDSNSSRQTRNFLTYKCLQQF